MAILKAPNTPLTLIPANSLGETLMRSTCSRPALGLAAVSVVTAFRQPAQEPSEEKLKKSALF